MPYKEKNGKFRGAFMIDGNRITRLFNTRAEAKKWEVEERTNLIHLKQTPAGMELRTFFSKYLDYTELSYTTKVFKEKRALAQKLVKEWGKETAVEFVNVDMVATYLERQVKQRSANAANKDRKNLLAMWTWGVKRYDFPLNPVIKVSKFRHDRKPQYTPPTEDIQRLLMAATREETVFLACYLNTGARRSEIFRLTWNDDVNFEKRQLRLGTRKTRDGSMDYQWMPMNEELYEALWWQWNNRKFPESPYVFVSESTRYGGEPFKVRRKFLKGLCKRAGIQPFGYHALRRYVASVLADTHKLSSKRIQRILRHKSVTTTERYIQNLNDDMRNDLDLLSQTNLHVDLHAQKKGVSQ